MHTHSRIIILHDYFLYRGGGERLVISMAKGLGADIATAFIAKDAFDPRAEGIPTRELFRETFLSRLPGFRYAQVQLAFLFKTKFLKEYDTVIYSGDCLIALLNARHARNVAYLHTPPRHLYDAYKDRLKEYAWWKKIIFIPFVWFNRFRFERLIRRFDVVVTNSKNTQARIKHYLRLDATVVYPPCTTLPFKNLGQGDYFFSWARLYPIKRVDKIVEAFTRMPDKKIIVASGGPDEEKIRALAKGHPNIHVLGWVNDAELLDLLGHCLATIYIPVREDFGMTAVESMVAGKPVIGVAEGGLLEIIEEGKNGVMLEPDFTVDDIIAEVCAMTPERALSMEQQCSETARRFGEERFVSEMKKIVEETD